MFSKITSFLTAFAILAHTVFGCCSHHAHAGFSCCLEEVKCDHSQAEVVEEQHHSHHCHATTPQADLCQAKLTNQVVSETKGDSASIFLTHSEHEHHFCDDGNCQFVFEVPHKWTLAFEPAFTGTMVELLSVNYASQSRHESNSLLLKSRASMRACQMYQVWLI